MLFVNPFFLMFALSNKICQQKIMLTPRLYKKRELKYQQKLKKYLNNCIPDEG